MVIATDGDRVSRAGIVIISLRERR